MESAISEKRSTAFTLSLASGVIIIFGSIMPWLFFTNFQTSPMGWMMSERGMMGWWTGPGFAGGWYLVLPLVAGIIVLVGAIMMKVRPKETRICGIIVLVFSIIGFTGMGFSILGTILGIIGGTIALSVTSKVIPVENDDDVGGNEGNYASMTILMRNTKYRILSNLNFSSHVY